MFSLEYLLRNSAFFTLQTHTITDSIKSFIDKTTKGHKPENPMPQQKHSSYQENQVTEAKKGRKAQKPLGCLPSSTC